MGCVLQFFFLVLFFSFSEVGMLLFVAQHTSIMFTILFCAFTGIVGGYFVRQQGLVTLRKIQLTLASGKVPADEAVEALMLLIVGILLCLPGFITDTLGFLIIIPFIRKPIAAKLANHFSKVISSGNTNIYTNFTNTGNKTSTQDKDNSENTNTVIEDAQIIEENKTKN